MYNMHLVATNACRWKYRRINLLLRHSNNADKKFQQYKRLNFSNHPISVCVCVIFLVLDMALCCMHIILQRGSVSILNR